MAQGEITFPTGNKYITGLLSWKSTSNGSSANTSNVRVLLSFKKSSSSTASTYGTMKGSVTIDGQVVNFSKAVTFNPNNQWVHVGTTERLIAHNSDGTKTIRISSSGYIGTTSFNYKDQGGTAKLDNIPRASAVSGGSGNIGGTTTIRIDRKSDTFTHSLTYLVAGTSGTIAENISTGGYGWVIPTSFYAKTPNSNSISGKIYCKTYSNGSLIGETSTDFTAYVTNSNPIVGTYSYADVNTTTTAITENNQRIIRNKSNLVFTLGTATARNSATISQYKVVFGGVTKTSATSGDFVFGTVNLSQNTDAVITVTDSRGNTSTATKTVIIDDWEAPTGLVTCQRKSNYYTETILKVDAKYSSLNGKNAPTIQYQYKKVSETTYSSLQTIEDNTETTISLDNSYQWNILVKVSDKLGSTTYSLVLDKGTPILFVDRNLRSIGINCFPTQSGSIESDGLVLDNFIYMGSQELYPSFTTSTAGTTSLLGAYDQRLLAGIFSGITIPTGYTRAYRITAQVQTANENTVTIYINNIATNSVGTWSGVTFRYILSSRIFKEDEVILEDVFNYTSRQGMNLKVTNSDSYLCNVYAITLHAYLVKTNTAIAVTVSDTTPTTPA